MSKKRVLVTGASGFIGKSVLNMLKGTSCTAIPLMRKQMGFENEIIVDFCDEGFQKRLQSLPRVDVIVHLGAKVSLGQTPLNQFIKPNLDATRQLAYWASKTKAYLIFASTAMVCGSKNKYITEISEPTPDTNYAHSKWLAEEEVVASGADFAILRIAGVFGKDGPKHLGINRSIDNALKSISPVQCGDGKIRRNYIYIKDLVDTIKFCIDNKIKGRYLVAGSAVNTISDMLSMICEVLLPGKKPERKEGRSGYDQIVESSPRLPRGSTFKEALRDIKNTK